MQHKSLVGPWLTANAGSFSTALFKITKTAETSDNEVRFSVRFDVVCVHVSAPL